MRERKQLLKKETNWIFWKLKILKVNFSRISFFYLHEPSTFISYSPDCSSYRSLDCFDMLQFTYL